MPRPTLRRSSRSRVPRIARRRGSIILFAIVSAVLLVLLGVAFVDLARFDRRAVAATDPRTLDDNGSIVRYIGRVLGRDVYPTTGNAEPYDYPWSNGSEETSGGGGTPMTDPWYPNDDAPNFAHWGNDRIPTSHFANASDDAHLASTEPVFNAAGDIDYWPHISYIDLVERPEDQDRPYLDLGDIVSLDGGTRKLPRLYAPKSGGDPAAIRPGIAPGDYAAATYLKSGTTNVPYADLITDNSVGGTLEYLNAADADGDGYLDSRWQLAPIKEPGKRYIMAVRVVDLSALANVNVWNNFGDESAIANDDDLPRWLWPGELDLHDVLADGTDSLGADTNLADTGGVTVDAFLGRVLGERFGAPTSFPAARNVATPWANANDVRGRFWHWINAGSTPGNANAESAAGLLAAYNDYHDGNITIGATDYTPTGVVNETELRNRNGINRKSDPNATAPDPASDLEKLQPGVTDNFLRQTENATDVQTDLAGTFPTPQDWFLREQRKRLTMLSGYGIFEEFQTDLNDDDLASRDDFFDLLVDDVVAGDPDSSFADTLPNRENWFAVAGADTEDITLAFAHAAAACLADFRDEDSRLSRFGDTYGMEHLPFISEVYVLQRYEGEVTAWNPVPPLPPTAATVTTATVDWTLVKSSNLRGDGTAMAIELVNPWPVTVDLPEELELEIDGEVWFDDLRQEIDSAHNAQRGGPKLTLQPNEKVILVFGESTAVPAPSQLAASPVLQQIEQLDSDTTVEVTTLYLNVPVGEDAWPVSAGGGLDNTVELVLRARVESDTVEHVPYQEFIADVDAQDDFQEIDNPAVLQILENKLIADPINYNPLDPADPETLIGYVQHSWRATANGFNVMTVRRNEFGFNSTGATPAPDNDLAQNAGFIDVNDDDSPADITGPKNIRFEAAPIFTSKDQMVRFGQAVKEVQDPLPGASVLDLRIEDHPDDVTVTPAIGATPWVIGNRGRIYRGGDVLRMVFWGVRNADPADPDLLYDPDIDGNGIQDDHTPADIWAQAQLPANAANARGRLTDFMIPVYAPTNLPTSNTDDLSPMPMGGADTAANENLSHAAFLLSRVTTLHPASDGRDNNGDGSDDDNRERLVPGALNLNTAPQWMLERALPWLNFNNLVAQAIVNARYGSARDAPYTTRTYPGLATPGELLSSLGLATATITTSLAGDFNEYTTLGATQDPALDGYIVASPADAPREDQIAIPSYLNQVASTRSDVYVAYVLVRAYPENDFDPDPINSPGIATADESLDEYRMIIVYDRSNVTEDDPMPRVVSVSTFRSD
ncbi:MAG: hypothetical protein AAF612_03555 [Planctomycetota bacterium]